MEIIITANNKRYICEATKTVANGKYDVDYVNVPDTMFNDLDKLEDEMYFDLVDDICIQMDNTGLFNEEFLSMHLPI